MKIQRCAVVLFCFAMLAWAVPAEAKSSEDRIIDQLQDQGYRIIEVRRTLLGRVRILAVEDDTLREIVVNPATGAILRDYWTEIDDDRYDDDDDDDDDDRDDGDDRRILGDDDDDDD